MDLYFRLAAIRIDIPPLSERKQDIPLLADKFLRDFEQARRAQQGSSPAVRIASSCQTILSQHSWPGNVRQLKNCIELAANLECVRKPLAHEIEVSVETLLEAESELAGVAGSSISPYDAVLRALGGQSLQRWADWTDERVEQLLVELHQKLSAEGNELLTDMHKKLQARTESRDPAAIHCYKALLYLLLNDGQSASMRELKAVLQLRAWEWTRKVATVLAEERRRAEPKSLISKTMSEGQWVFRLSNGVATGLPRL